MAKAGELPPKPKPIGTREAERLLYQKCHEIIWKPFIEAQKKFNEDW